MMTVDGMPIVLFSRADMALKVQEDTWQGRMPSRGQDNAWFTVSMMVRN
jgi:hypothetical protein